MLADYVATLRQRHGERFSAAGLDNQFAPYFGERGIRLKVEVWGSVVTGTVAASCGWQPVFLLMRTSRSVGSMWQLGADARIVGIKRRGERNYTPVRVPSGGAQ